MDVLKPNISYGCYILKFVATSGYISELVIGNVVCMTPIALLNAGLGHGKSYAVLTEPDAHFDSLRVDNSCGPFFPLLSFSYCSQLVIVLRIEYLACLI